MLRVTLAFALLAAAIAASAPLLLGACSTSAGPAQDAGPTYCAQNTGPVASCAVNATTGPVAQCGPDFPVCTPPSQTGASVWGCCSSSSIGGGVQRTVCRFGGAGDASCPCAGCGDAGQ
jgi:hypothetical protein